MNPAVSPVGGIDLAFQIIIGVSFVLLFAITAVMILFAVRYRRSRHPVPADIRGNVGLELAWMIIPTVIALAMFYLGWDSYVALRNVPKGALEIQVEGESFAWNFTYPDGKQTSSELVVPLGRPIKLNITSRDVIHSVFIPAFRIKMDAVKGLDTYAWFLPDRLGTFNILCAEYCGLGHSEMTADLRIVPKEEYEAWLAQKNEEPGGGARSSVSPEVLALFDPSKLQSIQDKMSFSWRVDGPLLHVKLKAPALGWVAVGFNPTRGMQDATYILAYVKNGKVYADEHTGTSLVKHEPVLKAGGTPGISNVFGSESNGVTEVGFTIPLRSASNASRAIDPNGNTTVLLSCSTGMDNFHSKHNYRKAFTVNLATGEYKPMGR